MSPQSRKVEQALHGYAEGHRRLASSLELSAEANRQMLSMSDASGPSVSGFDGYLTGYPVTNSDFYAVARTWFATEMDRPGCVWTHTLLLPSSCMAVPAIAAVAQLLKRPTLAKYESYQSALDVEFEKHNEEAKIRDLSAVVQALYSTRSETTVVEVPSSDFAEEIALFIWERQWPTLRAKFAFTTGALGPRRIGHNPLDLQFGPSRVVKRIARKFDASPIVLPTPSEPISQAAKPWVRAFCTASFKSFLTSIGETLPPDRDHMVPIANAFSIGIDKRAPLDRFLSFVVGIESQNLQRSLMLTLLCPPAELAGEFAFWPEDAVLLRLSDDFERWRDLISLRDWGKRLAELAVRDAGAATKALAKISSENSEEAEEVLAAVATQIDSQVFASITRASANVSLALVNSQPGLALVPDVHEHYELQAQLSIADSVLTANDDALLGEYAILLTNLVASRKTSFEVPARDETLFALFMKHLAETSPTAWAHLPPLGTAAKTAVSWVASHGTEFVDLAKWVLANLEIDPVMTTLMQSYDWSHLTKRIAKEEDGTWKIDALTVLLAIAFARDSRSASGVLGEGFQAVYDALAENRVTKHSWNKLRPVLPTIPWYKDWDHCEQLRRGLLEAIYYRGWKPDLLVQAITRPETLSEMLQHAYEWRYASLFTKLQRRVQSGKCAAEPWQAEMLTKRL